MKKVTIFIGSPKKQGTYQSAQEFIENLKPLVEIENYRDYRYYKEKGWFESDYYYDAPLGFIKKLTGHIFDFSGKRMAN